MKIIAWTILLLAYTPFAFAQVDWLSSDNSWTYSGLGFTATDAPNRLYIDRDTVVDGLSANVMLQDVSDGYLAYEFQSFDTIIVRQDGDKFYYYADGAFRVLYDFSLEVGDTMRLYIPEAIRSVNATEAYDYYKVDSAGTYSFGSRQLKGQHLTIISTKTFADGGLAEGWRYELLGVVDGYLLPYGALFCDGGCPRFLRCFSSSGDAGNSFFYKGVDFACDSIINSVREPDISHLFTAGPNPVRVGQTVRLRISESIDLENLQLLLYDAVGRQLNPSFTRTTTEVAVNIPTDASTGIYSLIIRTDKGRGVKRLVIMPSG